MNTELGISPKIECGCQTNKIHFYMVEDTIKKKKKYKWEWGGE